MPRGKSTKRKSNRAVSDSIRVAEIAAAASREAAQIGARQDTWSTIEKNKSGFRIALIAALITLSGTLIATFLGSKGSDGGRASAQASAVVALADRPFPSPHVPGEKERAPGNLAGQHGGARVEREPGFGGYTIESVPPGGTSTLGTNNATGPSQLSPGQAADYGWGNTEIDSGYNKGSWDTGEKRRRPAKAKDKEPGVGRYNGGWDETTGGNYFESTTGKRPAVVYVDFYTGSPVLRDSPKDGSAS